MGVCISMCGASVHMWCKLYIRMTVTVVKNLDEPNPIQSFISNSA